MDEFSEKLQTAFDPPLIFGKLYCNFFYNGYSCIYARRYEGQIVEGFRSAFLKVCLALIFLNTIVEKHTLNPEITLLNQFPARKALFKVPKGGEGEAIFKQDFFSIELKFQGSGYVFQQFY